MRPFSLLTVLMALLAPGVASAGAAEQLFERTVMSAADDRCRLFAPDLAAALDAARLQARGAALRAGATDAAVTGIERRARARVALTPCASADLATASARVRTAFDGWRDVGRMDFPGDRQGWTADRSPSRDLRWRIRQDARLGFDRATLGVAGAGATSALLVSVDGASPASARLRLRHLIRSPHALTAGPLPGRLPRSAGAVAYTAQQRTAAADGLRPSRDGATAFRFPAAALAALSRLDAREAIAVDFTDARGQTRTAWFEVGDFAAAQAFLAAARR